MHTDQTRGCNLWVNSNNQWIKWHNCNSCVTTEVKRNKHTSILLSHPHLYWWFWPIPQSDHHSYSWVNASPHVTPLRGRRVALISAGQAPTNTSPYHQMPIPTTPVECRLSNCIISLATSASPSLPCSGKRGPQSEEMVTLEALNSCLHHRPQASRSVAKAVPCKFLTPGFHQSCPAHLPAQLEPATSDLPELQTQARRLKTECYICAYSIYWSSVHNTCYICRFRTGFSLPNSWTQRPFSQTKLLLSYTHTIWVLKLQVKWVLHFPFVTYQLASLTFFNSPSAAYMLTIIMKFPNFPQPKSAIFPKLAKTKKCHFPQTCQDQKSAISPKFPGLHGKRYLSFPPFFFFFFLQRVWTLTKTSDCFIPLGQAWFWFFFFKGLLLSPPPPPNPPKYTEHSS